MYHLAGDYHVFYDLLDHEDPKVRKNVAIIMGELGEAEMMSRLFAAYEKEDKLFVKSDYLVALRKFDYRPLLEKLKKRLEFLTSNSFEETSMKHINEEIKHLRNLLLDIEGVSTHTFTGYNVVSDIVLLTNRDHREVTMMAYLLEQKI